MPLLKIETNVKSSNIKDMGAVVKELSQIFTKSIGKPEMYVMVQVVPDQVGAPVKSCNEFRMEFAFESWFC